MRKFLLSRGHRLVLIGASFLGAATLSQAADSPYFSGTGPVGGTNFGWGDRNLKMIVNRLTPPAEPISVDCYWIYKDGPRHGLALADHRQISGTSGNYEVLSLAQRNNGATFGITQGGGPGTPAGRAGKISKPNQANQPGGTPQNGNVSRPNIALRMGLTGAG
jgi:hypothetical protein